jgi:hypothetical protein
MDLLAARAKTDWTSWHALWRALPFSILACFFTFQAVDERNIANKQQTSFGVITDCREAGRDPRNHCNYTFPVGNKMYPGNSPAQRLDQFGSTVVVYYDVQNPVTNSLEDFSDTCRRDRHFAYVFILLTAGVVAFILFSKDVGTGEPK